MRLLRRISSRISIREVFAAIYTKQLLAVQQSIFESIVNRRSFIECIPFLTALIDVFECFNTRYKQWQPPWLECQLNSTHCDILDGIPDCFKIAPGKLFFTSIASPVVLILLFERLPGSWYWNPWTEIKQLRVTRLLIIRAPVIPWHFIVEYIFAHWYVCWEGEP